jgi:hypothetical protein
MQGHRLDPERDLIKVESQEVHLLEFLQVLHYDRQEMQVNEEPSS